VLEYDSCQALANHRVEEIPAHCTFSQKNIKGRKKVGKKRVRAGGWGQGTHNSTLFLSALKQGKQCKGYENKCIFL